MRVVEAHRQNIAFSKVARHAILTHDAMDVARMMAHITYLSEEGMERKFQRARRVPDAEMTLHSDFEVEHYLDHQAKIFLARFDPGTYLYLSRVMDYYDAVRRRAAGAAEHASTCSSPSARTGGSAPSTP